VAESRDLGKSGAWTRKTSLTTSEDVRWEHHPTGNAAQDQDVPYMRPRSGRAAAAGFFQDIEEDFEMNSFNPIHSSRGTAASRQ
jgi:hypothetical protein